MEIEYSAEDLKRMPDYLFPVYNSNKYSLSSEDTFLGNLIRGLLFGCLDKNNYNPVYIRKDIYGNDLFSLLTNRKIQNKFIEILYKIEYKDLPLYINDNIIGWVVRWRLCIGK